MLTPPPAERLAWTSAFHTFSLMALRRSARKSVDEILQLVKIGISAPQVSIVVAGAGNRKKSLWLGRRCKNGFALAKWNDFVAIAVQHQEWRSEFTDFFYDIVTSTKKGADG